MAKTDDKTAAARKLLAKQRAEAALKRAREEMVEDAPAIVLVPSKLRQLVTMKYFGLAYAVFAGVVLAATSFFWSFLSARVQQGNADNLVDAYLFERADTFRGALFPSTHTFLLKWPAFLIIKFFGYSDGAFIGLTVLFALLTVGFLALVLYKIDKRPMVFGTLCLALASVLLLVPTTPYSGGLLPVNMAMLATRNLEYVLYIVAMIILVRSPKVRSWRFWAAVGLLGLLIASDKLFLSLTGGAALAAVIVYALVQRWSVVTVAVRWLMAGLFAAGAALAALWIIGRHGITNIVSSGNLGPYTVVHNLHDLVLGSIYGVLGLLTNFGANPAFDATTLRAIPHQLATRLWTPGGPAFVINAIIMLAGLGVVAYILILSFGRRSDKESRINTPARLSLALIWTSLAAVGLYVISNHYYAVDARYLAIALFAVFISLATFASRFRWRPEVLVSIGAVIVIGIILATTTTFNLYRKDTAALADINARNVKLAQAVNVHPVDALVGDYWRVIPTKQRAKPELNVVPLADCTKPRESLSSKAWETDLSKHSFAYLLSADRSLTDYPKCDLQEVVKNYGKPNASINIAGPIDKPKETLLFYDKGINVPTDPTTPPATVVPISPEQLPFTYCDVPSVMNIVAHEDDDLLFMNPAIINDINAGHCVRTVYLTTGDGGFGEFYWLKREQGSEAAYSKMLGIDDIWIQRIVELSDNAFVTVAKPRNNSKVTLIFMHLPDGNLNGQGFKATRYESLTGLENNNIDNIHTVYGQTSYTLPQLTAALTTLMHIYQPSEIRTQSTLVNDTYPDHSDHMAVSRLAKSAYDKYETEQYAGQVTIPIKYYIGYPIHSMGVNVTGPLLAEKQAVFLEYAKFDKSVCQTTQQCAQTPTYSSYLEREYEVTQVSN